MDSKKSLDSALEPDLIISSDFRILSISEQEQKRLIVAGWCGVVEYMARIFRGGSL